MTNDKATGEFRELDDKEQAKLDAAFGVLPKVVVEKPVHLLSGKELLAKKRVDRATDILKYFEEH